jgi:hypothetical protein
MNPPQQSRVDKTMKLHTNRGIVRILNKNGNKQAMPVKVAYKQGE